jgi:hypothetical protein
MADYGHTEIIDWFLEKHKNSDTPYFYHKQTIYVINHESINKWIYEWISCKISDRPVSYIGILDKPSVIAYMATLKKPKSTCS